MERVYIGMNHLMNHIGHGTKYSAFKDMGIHPCEIKTNHQEPNEYFLNKEFDNNPNYGVSIDEWEISTIPFYKRMINDNC